MKQENGITWYTEAFLIEQLRMAEQNGFVKGVRIEFHAVQPSIDIPIEKLKEEFKNFCLNKQIFSNITPRTTIRTPSPKN